MTPEEITSLFATAAAAFQPIVGQPNDDDLTLLRDTLYPLLLQIPYDEAGTHNLIGILEPTTTYTVTWHAAFPMPVRPPTYPAIPDAATAVVRAREEANHAVLVKDYAAYEAAERATSKFIRDNVDELWYRDLRHQRSYYNNVTAKELIEHLDANCGGLHPSELVNLPTEMMGYYSKADGIPEYIDMLEEAQRKLARANLPMSDDQLLAIASTSVLASGHFPRPTDEWEALPRANKTWTAWKPHYRAAHLARRRQQLATGTSPFGGSANAASACNNDPVITAETFTRLDGYLDNLASAASTEKTTLNQLIENNAALTASVTALTASLTALTAAYTILAAGGKPPTPAPAASAPKKKKGLDPNGYCWTHGYRVTHEHSSANCRAKAEGHKDTATRNNIMGGSTKGLNSTT
jgi:hypothetical protein